MTSRSRRKHPITAPTSTEATPTSAAAARPAEGLSRQSHAAAAHRRWACSLAATFLLGGPAAAVAADPGLPPSSGGMQPSGVMRPVPTMSHSVAPAAPSAAAPRDGWNLRWRRPATGTASPTPASVAADASAARDRAADSVPGGFVNGGAVKGGASPRGAVRQVNHQQLQDEDDRVLPLPAIPPLPDDTPDGPDAFDDPFGDADPSAERRQAPQAADEPDSPYDRPGSPQRPAGDAPRRNGPSQGAPPLEGPETAGADDRFENPFDRAREPELPQIQPPRAARPQPRMPELLSCDEIRRRIAARTIDAVSLDISPRFRPDLLEERERLQRLREFEEAQPLRTWRSLDGTVAAEGRLRDIRNLQAVIEGADGEIQQVLLANLSEPDLAFIGQQWGLPRECHLPQEPYQERQWLASTMTWTASGLCHKPLYFEEVNLERYGHTAGPLMQPVLSSAHFFVNIAVLPYKMGVHPPTDCRYALGYYRPGNPAPWIVPPVPISLRGAAFQAAAVGGMVALIP